MKIEEVLDTPSQPTWCVSPKPVSTIGKNDESEIIDVEYQELHNKHPN